MPTNIELFRRHNHNSVFIETGSFNGDGIKNALFSDYKEIHSIELAESRYYYCKSHFRYNPNVHLYLGDSVKELPKILQEVKEPATFWLDAHYSGYGTTFAETLTPLMRELDVIGKHEIKTHTIIIDDLREWKRDYPAIGFGVDDIKEKILEINPDYMFSFAEGFIPNDILVAETRRYRPINIIVFSKDRAMQLELFLRSFNTLVKFADRYEIKVLYTYSNDDFGRGYEKLQAMTTPNVVFVKEVDFKQDMIRLIDPINPHTVFFVDDNVFKEDCDFYDKQMEIFNWDDRIACRSLRLHKSLSFCYPTQKPMKQPRFLADNIFDWTSATGDYGYPMSQDGHIFRTKEIRPMHTDLVYTSPNLLEGAMDRNRGKMGHYMMCYDRSPIMNTPLNKVQTTNNNLSGNITAESLNEKFLEGFIIDHSPFIGFMNMSCHQEKELNFINTCTDSLSIAEQAPKD